MIEIKALSKNNKNLSKFNKKTLKNIKNAINLLQNQHKSGVAGFLDTPLINKSEITKINRIAKQIRANYDVMLVIGIGGSYLGSASFIDALQKTGSPKIKFIGLDYSASSISHTLENVRNKNVFVNVISKSGNTTETLVAFELIKDFLIKKHGKDYYKHILVTTSANSGYLQKFAHGNKIKTLTIPENVGGRYSVLTNVGLLPMAIAGININNVLKGALNIRSYCLSENIENNPSAIYAGLRYLLYKKHKKNLEVVSSFNPELYTLLGWHQQLFTESEGKDKKGLYVSTATYPKDLHSVGQFIQDGSPIFFETLIDVKNLQNDITLKNIDTLSPINYLKNKTLNQINNATINGTINAHMFNTPIIQISIPCLNEQTFGALIFMLETSCVISANLLKVNPFNQPGVEEYKKLTKQYLNN